MSPVGSQQWARRVRASDQHIRVSDVDRNAVTELLTQHYTEGRLDQGEFDERVGQAMAAKTRGDLVGLFDDLPDLDAPDGDSTASGATRPYRPQRRRPGLLRLALLVVLVLVCANVAWHAFASLFFVGPLVWAFVIFAAIFVISRSRRRSGS
jgi:hypothetical protein